MKNFTENAAFVVLTAASLSALGTVSCMNEDDTDGTGVGPSSEIGMGRLPPATGSPSEAGHAWCNQFPEKEPFVGGAEGVWGSGPTDIWYIVTDKRAGVYDTNVYPHPTNEQVLLVHKYPKIAHWDGRTLCKTSLSRFFPKDDPRALKELWAIWGSSSTDVWAGGQDGSLFHWDGRTWKPQEPFTTNHIGSITGNRPDNVWAREGSGSTILARWDGSSWARREFGLPFSPRDIWVDADDGIWLIVSEHNAECVVYHHAPSGEITCQKTPGADIFNFPLVRNIGGFGRQPFLIVQEGAKRNVVMTKTSLQGDWSWRRVAVDKLYSISGVGPDNVWFGGVGEFYRWDGTSLNEQDLIRVPAPGLGEDSVNWIMNFQATPAGEVWGRRASVIGGEGGFVGQGTSFRAL